MVPIRPARGLDDSMTPNPDVIAARDALLLLGLRHADALRHATEHGGWAALQSPRVQALIDPAHGLTREQRLAVVCRAFGRPVHSVLPEVRDPQAVISEADQRLADSTVRRAVILEDEWLTRRDLEDCCRTSGVELVLSSREPELAVTAARAYRPHLAIIDLEIDGNELAGDIAAMRIVEEVPGTAIVFVSAHEVARDIADILPRARAFRKPARHSDLNAAFRKASLSH